MKKDELMKLLRNPAQYRKDKKDNTPTQRAQKAAATQKAQTAKKKEDIKLLGVAGVVLALFALTFVFFLSAKNRAENVAAALDPEGVKGLAVADKEFNPNTGVTYVQVQEGHDRSVAVTELGSTLPIISRFNYKTFTPASYQVIGAAPWALTTNFSSNIQDPDLMRYLLANDDMIKAFLARPDVAPLLEDPQMLSAFAQDQNTLKEFFESDVVKQVLASEKMVQAVAGSRWMSYLLISASGKYFRKNPQEAAVVIQNSPALQKLRSNSYVRGAVQNNRYLKDIAPTILGAQPRLETQPKMSAQPAKKSSKKTARKK